MIQTNHLDCQSKASGAIRCLTMSAFTRVDFEKAGAIPHLVVLLSSGNQVLSLLVLCLSRPAPLPPCCPALYPFVSFVRAHAVLSCHASLWRGWACAPHARPPLTVCGAV